MHAQHDHHIPALRAAVVWGTRGHLHLAEKGDEKGDGGIIRLNRATFLHAVAALFR